MFAILSVALVQIVVFGLLFGTVLLDREPRDLAAQPDPEPAPANH